MSDDEIITKFIDAHHLVITTRNKVIEAKKMLRIAIKDADAAIEDTADADFCYRELIKKREAAKNAT